MPDTELSSSLIPLNGDRIVTPALKDVTQSAYRIVLEGTFKCAYNGKEYDALYTTDENGQWTVRHNYVLWAAPPPQLESADVAQHRYVFRVPAVKEWEGRSVGMKVNVDKFVEDFLISPSEVRTALSGELKMTVLHAPLVVPLFPRVVSVALPALLVAGGVAFIVRRRMTWGNLATDLQEILVRIEQKYRAARAAVSREQRGLFPLHDKLTALRDGAFALTRQIQKLRNAQQLVDRRALEADIARLEQQLSALRDETAKRDGEITLTEKQRTLSLLDDMAQNAARCAMRLTKIEATLDTLAVTLRHAQTQQFSPPAEETLRRELDAEVTAIQDTTRDLQAFEELRAQMMTQRR